MKRAKVSSNAAAKQPKKMPRGKPFVKGDPRINREGRKPPKDVQEFNALLDEIFAEEIETDKGKKVQKLRIALDLLLLSKNPSGAIHLLERRFGKIPQPVTLEGNEDKPIKIVVEYADANGNKTNTP